MCWSAGVSPVFWHFKLHTSIGNPCNGIPLDINVDNICVSRNSLWENSVLFLVREYPGHFNGFGNIIKRIQRTAQPGAENTNWLPTQCKTNKRNVIVSTMIIKCNITETNDSG